MFDLIYFCIKSLTGDIIYDGVITHMEDNIYPAQYVDHDIATDYCLPFECEACKFWSNGQSTFTSLNLVLIWIIS